MQLTSRKLALLNAIEIPVWVRRDIATTKQSTATTLPIPIDIKDNQLFKDILHTLALTTDDVTVTSDHIDLGTTNWYFTPAQDISFLKNVLTTPELSAIATNSELKKKLWQILANNLIS
ncbi:DNA polymerase III subunit psi [Thalassotalea fusca]